MAAPEEPFRPDVWGDRAATDRPRLARPGATPAAGPDTGTGRPLDLSQDPDRMPPAAGQPASPLPPAAPPVAAAAAPTPRRLDPRRDPDRFAPGDRTLTDLLGEGAQEEPRDNYAWLGGLLGILAFLAAVAFLSRYLGP